MKTKIREKIIASVMLGAFVLTNTMTGAFAMSDVYGGYVGGADRPTLRSGESTALDIRSSVKIHNGDSVVNLSLRDADIKQVLRMFADQAGMNIIFSSSVEGTVTMDLVDIPLEEALNLVIKTNGLFYDIQANTLVVSNKDEAMSVASKGMTLIPVKYVNAAALAKFLNTNIFTKNGINPGVSTQPVVTINPATNELIVMGTTNDVEMAKRMVAQFDVKPTITTFKVNHTTPMEMASMICDSFLPSTISDGNEGGSSGGSGSSSGSGSSASGATGFAAGVVTGFASDDSSDSGDSSDSSSSGSSSGGGGTGNSISVGGGKMLCSAASSASASGYEGLPFKNLSVSYFPTLGTIQVIGGTPTQIDMIRDYIVANDKKTPQAYLEVQIISLSESGSKTFDNTWQFLSKNFSFNAGGGNGFATNSEHPIFFAGRGFETSSSSSSSGSSSGSSSDNTVSFSKWSQSPQLVYAVNYLVENKKGRVLANPRILLTSGQNSVIDLTSDYVSKVTSEYLDNSSGSGSAQVQKDYDIANDNGIKVSITPFISPDGYVTLDINPNYATIKEQLYTKSKTGNNDLAATLLQRRNLTLKGVRIKDGETLVIGGMIQEAETKNVSKIPFLGDLPVVGMFFRSTGTEKSKEEMVIMLTPQIVVDTEDAVGNDTTL